MSPKTNRLDYDVEEMIAADKDFLWHHLKDHNVFEDKEQMVIVEGKGLVLKDIRGREYLDAVSGGVWGVVVGYGRESIAEAVAEQLKKLCYYAGAVGTVPAIKYAKKLAEKLPGQRKIFFSNSGSEANEKAFKIIRQLAKINDDRKGKFKVIYRDRDYHGTTIGALSAGGQSERKEHFGPMADGFAEFPHPLCYRCAFGKTYPDCNIECARALEDVILKEGPDTVGGVIVEPIVAGGGILVPVKEYYPILQQICKKYGAYLIFDEVVCGFGRTGKFWGHEHYDVQPDMVTMAKGVASCYEPLSVTAISEKIFNLFLDTGKPETRLNYFRDISTYGGCTGAMAAGLETSRIIDDENLVENSRVVGEYLLNGLKDFFNFPIVGDVRGKGLFCGVEFVEDKASKTPVSEAFMGKLVADVAAEGVLVGRTNSSLPGMNTMMLFAPALVATKDQMDQIITAVKKAIEKNV